MKRISKKRPGWDCIRHPCGRNGCGTLPGASHGIHCEDWIFAVSDGDVAAVLVVFSGVFPASVPPMPDFEHRYPTAASLALHVGFPHDAPSEGDECEFVDGGRCYHSNRHCTFSGADEFFNLHFDKAAGFDQPERFWLALERELPRWAAGYRSRYGDDRGDLFSEVE